MMDFETLGDNALLAEHLKELEDDALLDFWRDTHALDASLGLLARRPFPIKENGERSLSGQEDLGDALEFVLHSEASDTRFFAIPRNVHAENRSRFFWGRAKGREDVVLQELQLRSAQSGLSGRTLLK